MNFTRVALVFPVINGEIWLGKRNTPPYKGYWSPIGGKAQEKGPALTLSPTYKRSPGEMKVPVVGDEIARVLGNETSLEAGIRELCEEVFVEQRYPDDFSVDDFTEGIKLAGDVAEEIGGKTYINYLHVVRINRNDFSLSPREIADFKPLSQVKGKVTPIAFLFSQWLHTPEFLGAAFFETYERTLVAPPLSTDICTYDAKITVPAAYMQSS